MKSYLNSGALVALSVMVGGCSGDDGNGTADGSLNALREQPAGDDVEEAFDDLANGDEDRPFDACAEFDFRPFPRAPRPTGSAHLSRPATADSEAVELDLPEAICETYPDANNDGVHYGVSFFATWEDTDTTPEFIAIDLRTAFTGDGQYTEASLTHGSNEPLSLSTTERFELGSLTLSEGGRVGTFTSTRFGTEVTYSCGDASKISSTPRPLDEVLPAGTLRFVGLDDAIRDVSGIQCATSVDDFSIASDDESPFWFNLDATGTGTGEHSLTVVIAYAGLYGQRDYGRMNLVCGNPARGTFTFGTARDGVYPQAGNFTCQE